MAELALVLFAVSMQSHGRSPRTLELEGPLGHSLGQGESKRAAVGTHAKRGGLELLAALTRRHRSTPRATSRS